MVKIISDSTSDLTKELIDKLDISVIPLHILLGNDECLMCLMKYMRQGLAELYLHIVVREH